MKCRNSPSSIEPLEPRIAPASCAVVDLGEINGTNGFRTISGQGAPQGWVVVSEAGDVNGDGLGDILLGHVDNHRYSGTSGQAYVLFGRAEGFGATVDLNKLDGTNGFRFYTSLSGPGGRNLTGASLNSAGDINGDGFDDVIIASS